MTYGKKVHKRGSFYSTRLLHAKYHTFVLIWGVLWATPLLTYSQVRSAQLATKHANTTVDQIRFTATKTSHDTPMISDYITSWNLYNDSYLGAHFELDHPLTHYLSLLDADTGEKERLAKGNFQFTFLVDDQVVYEENLHPGAGTIEDKKTKLSYNIPMVTSKPIDFWGWFMWLKFMKMGGGRDALNVGTHTLTLQLRAYLDADRLLLSDVLASGDLTIQVAERPIVKGTIAVQDIAPTSDWEISKDVIDHNTIETLNKKILQNRFEHINGIVVIKDDKLLLEEYFNGATRDSLHDTRSVGKSFTSALLGMAIADGYILDERTTLNDYYPLETFLNYSKEKAQVTLHDLLSMSSGFEGDDTQPNSRGNEENMYPTSNWVKFALDLPMAQPKSDTKSFSYFTAGVILLGDIINTKVPNGLIAYADKKLFSPLDIRSYRWQYTPKGVGNTAGSIQLRALDLAKFGQLYKNDGLWEGSQILPKSWVTKSLSTQVSISKAKQEGYGYLFWNKTLTVGDRSYEVSYSSGNGGNKIFIFKELALVVVITASAYNLPYAHKDVEIMLTHYILPAIFDHS
ncbi:MAG: serine hydrolase [Dokdonia sp.]|jgi:CubicO group peptidase (beta-lactamase class C family)